eukprot:8369369-Prorocentrum_lima.AAC.1
MSPGCTLGYVPTFPPCVYFPAVKPLVVLVVPLHTQTWLPAWPVMRSSGAIPPAWLLPESWMGVD